MKRFKVIISDRDSSRETAPTSNFGAALSAMNEILDDFKFGDNGHISIDAKYLNGIPHIWHREQPDAIALRILHLRPQNSKRVHRVIGKVVICN